MRKLLICGVMSIVCCAICGLSAQDVRSIDGYGNNFANPYWGAVDSELPRLSPADYSDRISTPNGVNRANPRELSNYIFAQDELKFDQTGLSDFVWVFGQFIDHDFSLVFDDPAEAAVIAVPVGDPDFDPNSEGLAIIPMFRSRGVEGTGETPFRPRQYSNEITSFIDGSGVYGSTEERAHWLRNFQDGKLKTSQGDLLPWNTITGELTDAVDASAPEMADDTRDNEKRFVAGDFRANENVLLTTLHTLFVREHNRICDAKKIEHPELTDEELYQSARRWVSAYIQSIVYNEWLPAMGLNLPEYEAYDPFVNPTISNEFSAAAFRLGHTLINSEIARLGIDGKSIPEGPVSLRDAFFKPMDVHAIGIDPMLRGMSVQVQQDMDNKMVDDLRNFLFGEPGAGGLDLAAININRGRERGVADFNSTRMSLGMSMLSSFDQIHSDPEIAESLSRMYGNVNNIDLWTGLLAEEHLSGSMMGPTLYNIMEDQFLRLREGDRFFYLNDEAFTLEEQEIITDTRLSDIIKRNSGVERIPNFVFKARSYEDISFENVPLEPVDFAMNVFPNPVIDFAAVKFYSEQAGDAELIIYSPLGTVIHSRQLQLQEGENNIVLQELGTQEPGAFLISVYKDGKSKSKTVIKQ